MRPGAAEGYRLAQVANYVGPTSGGLGAVVHALGAQHLARGDSRLVITPGPRSTRRAEPDSGAADEHITLASPLLPGSAKGHHVLLARAAVRRPLEAFEPQILQLHDQTTVAWLAGWSRRRGIPTVLFAHEQLTLVAREVSAPLPSAWSDRVISHWSGRLAARVDAVVCASEFAAQQYRDAGATNVHRMPFGVDLDRFRPLPRPENEPPWRPGALRLIMVNRLYAEKSPGLALDTLQVLREQGFPAELVVIGSGPLEPRLRADAAARRLPVHMLGHLRDRARVARLSAAADVAIAPGPRETFGLAVLELMASGTPVVVNTLGAARELLAPGVGLAAGSATEAADAVVRLAADPSSGPQARRHAEGYSWAASASRLRSLELSLLSGSAQHPRRRAATAAH